jgi:hypothetical protein
LYIQGSGKTYTIGGGNISPVTEDEDGIIPRAVRQMFDTLSVSFFTRATLNILDELVNLNKTMHHF